MASNDNSIKDVIPNDIKKIVDESKIKAIFTTGAKAYSLYNKYLLKDVGIEAIKLPSTSPANCKRGIEKVLVNSYSKIREYLD